MASDIIYSVKFEKGRKTYGIGYFGKSVVSLCQPKVINSVAGGYRYYINKFVPKKDGYLRRSAHAVYKVGGERDAGGNGTGSATVYWGERNRAKKYAHYQFVGDVYGPNKVKYDKKGELVWRSMAPKNGKYNTGRKMGHPYYKELADGRVIDVKGYTTSGTGYNWIKRFKEDKGDYGETAINIRAARYLYEASCIKSRIKPYGGARIYHSWNQIKNRLT